MLKISDNGRFIAQRDGAPFFYLGDTAWALFQKLNKEETEYYLSDRAKKGFTVIQAVIISEFDGMNEGNYYGDLPFHNGDIKRPNEKFFEHVDDVIDKADSLGLYVGLLPTWGDKVGPLLWGTGPEVFNEENAFQYGKFLGNRYQEKSIIWILGGDRNPDSPARKKIWVAMADGIKEGDRRGHLMSFHPVGVTSTSTLFPGEEWLDFNMLQSCHLVRDRDNYNFIRQDYILNPDKPCMDAEPNYEDMPVGMLPGAARFTDYDARKAAYWALFAGAHGHTYGANGVFQFWDGKQPNRFSAVQPWRDALQFPGAGQLQYAKNLMLSRPFFTRMPAPMFLKSPALLESEHIQATISEDGSYAFIYSAAGKPFTVDLSELSGDMVNGFWYDPRNGEASFIGQFPANGLHEFDPPTEGNNQDWVLVLDEASKRFHEPGAYKKENS